MISDDAEGLREEVRRVSRQKAWALPGFFLLGALVWWLSGGEAPAWAVALGLFCAVLASTIVNVVLSLHAAILLQEAREIRRRSGAG